MTFAEHLREYRRAHKFSVGTLSGRLKIAKHRLCAWSPSTPDKKSAFPPKTYWPKLIAAGVVTESELLAMRPKTQRKPRLTIRFYSLAQYARKKKRYPDATNEFCTDKIPNPTPPETGHTA